MDRKISLYILVVVIFFGVIGSVLFGASVLHIMSGGSRLGIFRGPIMTVAEFPRLVRTLLDFKPQITANRFPEINGFKRSGKIPMEVKSDKGYLLLANYDTQEGQSTIRLLRIRDDRVIFKWVPDFSELTALQTSRSEYSDPVSKRYSEFMHPVLLEDGGLIVKITNGILFKINSCSAVEWSLDGVFHHSTEQNAEGEFWVGSVMDPSSYLGTGLTHRDDAIAKISPDGRVLFKKSVVKILEENGYRGLLAAGYTRLDSNPIHLNDIQPALIGTEFWEKGDLLLSLRGLSTILLYRPETDKVIWLKVGPWMNQHDANFVGQSSISVFGNNIIIVPPKPRLRPRPSSRHKLLRDGHNNIYLFDFKTSSLKTPYTKVMKENEVRTLNSGRAGMLPNGDFLVDESNNSRLLRITPERVKWEYVNSVNEDHSTSIGWARYFSPEQVQSILPKLQDSICGE